MKTIVLYHSADFDGLFCEAIARKFLPGATFIGWDFKDKPLPFPDKDTHYFVMDLPLDKPFGLKFEDGWLARDNPVMMKEHRQIQPIDRIDWSQWTWIDHHKSSIESTPPQVPGYRIDGVAACRLAWQWFTNDTARNVMSDPAYLPTKEEYVNRSVEEPHAIRLAGEYDIWDKRDPDAELFQHGLRSMEITPARWELLLEHPYRGNGMIGAFLEGGKALQYARTNENASIITDYGFTIQFEGLSFLACNHARFNSHLFTAGLKPEHDACFGFKWTGKDWSVSLYHAPGKEHHDLSLIAVKHGGGGHRGACGFSVKKLPFLP